VRVSYDGWKPVQPESLPMAKPNVFRTCDTALIWPRMPSAGDASILVMDIQLSQSQSYDAERLQALQLNQLSGLIDHAFATVPFYRDRLTSVCTASEATNLTTGLTIDMWRQIPILKRDEVVKAGAKLQSTAVPSSFDPITGASTSGTTGDPVTIKKSSVDQLFFHANRLRAHRWTGVEFSKPMANITVLNAHTKKLADQNKAVPWAAGHVSGPMYYCDTNRPVDDKIDWLLKTKVAYLMTSPSSLRDLITRSKARNISFETLSHIICTGEPLSGDTRALCDEEWSLPVWDIYSTQEAGIIAAQCPDHEHLHTMAESLMVEVLDNNDTPCQPGQTGRVVVTPLQNFVMPLIRYEIGDQTEVGEAVCSCGRGLPVIKHIQRVTPS